ncbi:putative permease, YjgP/YjgQ family superfamily [[Synechococcus] sp. NIES-970]|uniref:LptF/LptG family permease n=1 Tax=Picosynechococcus sp. NKBG15041c TaxID=1407650 RepID=UPI0004243AF6|nr:LptF/LptG family permease [Picosynechococcus sp. NKBG15041c]BAW96040.1 putative permease, YjgP/YjgQ family superfamily [[Synechococcus] sp. NIES-970]
MAQLVGPFLFGLGIFTSLGLTIGVLFEVLRNVVANEITWAIAFQILALRLPEFLVLGLPMATLLGTLTAYSNLSSFSEIIALRSAGVSPLRLMLPGLILGLLITGFTFSLNDWIVPGTLRQATKITEIAKGEASSDYQEKNIIYPEYQRLQGDTGNREILKTLFYAENFDGKQMNNLTILDRATTDTQRIITALAAQWNPAQEGWQMREGSIYQIAANGSFSDIEKFETSFFKLSDAPLVLATQCQQPNEMTLPVIDLCLESLRLSRNERRIRTLQVKKQEKFSVPFVCIVFAMVGSAIGLRPQNSSRATSVGLSVAIVFAYYMISVISSSIGVWGTVTPFLGAWFPNILGLVAAGTIIWRTG